jgi:ABC-type multidrug transport system ATPase subunit
VTPRPPSGRPAVPAVETVGLEKRYGDVEALAPLDLTVAPGERVAVIGHNGSGKTTLIKMLVGLLEPTGGSARIGGRAAASLEARSMVSYLSDEPVFYDDLSLAEHLDFVARMHGTSDATALAADLVDRLGLAHRVDDLPVTFSRGLRQKAAIALAFVRPFTVMLVDEPFVGLDRPGRGALLELFAEGHRNGVTLLVATHELATVGAADRLVALADGTVVYDGAPEGADLERLTVRPDATD